MEIVNVELRDEQELIDRLRKITMLKDRSLYPYKDASISLENLCLDELHPPQRYVLKSELFKVRELKWNIAEREVDLFNLNGFARLTLGEEKEVIDLLPPIVEEVIENNGRISRVICDGMHRMYMAYLEWEVPQVVYIRGIPKDVPYYAFPIPDQDWTKIEIRDDIPSGFIKKWHRIKDNKKLYRDFNSAFENVGAPRGNTVS